MPVDYSKYPTNWKTEIVPAVLKRDGHCCKFCQVPNKAIIYRPTPGQADWEYMPEGSEADVLVDFEPKIKFVKIVLTVAHLDHDEDNHDVQLERLAALCQRCHLRYDIDEKRHRRELKKNGGAQLF